MTLKRIALVAAVLVLAGCEREVVGETYAGQLHGGRSLEVTGDAPPRGATSSDKAPATVPEYTRAPLLADGYDPGYRGMLYAAGAHFPAPPSVRRIVAPPAPVPLPVVPAPEPAAVPVVVPPVPAAAVAPTRPALRAPIIRPAVRPAPAAAPGAEPAAP